MKIRSPGTMTQRTLGPTPLHNTRAKRLWQIRHAIMELAREAQELIEDAGNKPVDMHGCVADVKSGLGVNKTVTFMQRWGNDDKHTFNLNVGVVVSLKGHTP